MNIIEINKVFDLLDSVFDDVYHLQEEQFSFYSDRLYNAYAILDTHRKMKVLKFDRYILKENENNLYLIIGTQILKFEKLQRRATKGELIIIESDKCLLGEDSNGKIFIVEDDNDEYLRGMISRHLSIGMCAIYDTQYKVLNLIDTQDIELN